MTIYTTDRNHVDPEKKDLIDDGCDVEISCPEKSALTKDVGYFEGSVYNDPVVPIRTQPRPRRSRLCVSLCLFMGILIGVSACVVASLFMYSSLSYRGKCGVTIDMRRPFNASDEMPNAEGYKQMKERNFVEEVEIQGNWCTVLVPEDDDDDIPRAKFTNDFKQNVTAIQDMKNEVCYLLPMLDSRHIPNPKEFYNKLQTFEDAGVFPHLPEVMQSYRVSKKRSRVHLENDLRQLCGSFRPYFASFDEELSTPEPTTSTTTTTTTTTTAKTSPEAIEYGDAMLDEIIDDYIKFFRLYAGGDDVITFRLIILEDDYEV